VKDIIDIYYSLYQISLVVTLTVFALSLQCALSFAAQCIVIGPVCGFVCLCVCLCGSVTTITRNCVHRSSPNWVCRWR